MKTKLFLLMAIATITISSCKKDLANDWEGTYTGISGSSFNRIVISKVDKSTIQLQLQTASGGGFITYATIAKGKLTSANTLQVDEDGALIGVPYIYHYTGVGSLSGNTLTISGQGQNKSDATDIKPYTFTGSR